ncbi:hypothetical protein MOVS_01450 [Moraxella ovis]|uniref:Uncharacterized protein n=1 Tax=Moraxella ovis TaxID=29433 RepID=A0A378PHR1_9GAMM|nr:hypothetical protein [Moraxella ovis]ANB90878.1 hypothetical protein MOVS_01450 [Moraxella ovis]STY86324.1 Uncharacterised protein [Moraxella ovis]
MKQNIKLIRGDGTCFEVVAVMGEQAYDLSVIDRADLHVKHKHKTVIRLSTTDGSIVVDEGKMYLNFASDATQGLNFKLADYDLQIIKDGKIKTIMYGMVELQHDITII